MRCFGIIPSNQRTDEAIQLMLRFADRTGLTSNRAQQRYLWTDAFAVCNFLGIARATGQEHYAELAVELVHQVHRTLARHRSDDTRAGWISGLSEEDGELHPTRGGLRIGKKLPERRVSEPFDEQLEWDRDGQYFHYLTKWMHALDQVARFIGQPRFNLWARELAETAYKAFTLQGAKDDRRMVWKMSIDLSRPLVPSMGHHDPLDGFITCVELQSTASAWSDGLDQSSLMRELAGFASMIEGRDWATADPLGLGGLLMDACRVEQLMGRDALPNDDLLRTLLVAALEGLRYYARNGEFGEAASTRLAFRELGLAIGLHAIELIAADVQRDHRRFSNGSDIRALLEELGRYVSLVSAIESFWLAPDHREARTWSEHRDINEVMLATSLIPAGFLMLSSMADTV
jgi:hypothetical protein